MASMTHGLMIVWADGAARTSTWKRQDRAAGSAVRSHVYGSATVSTENQAVAIAAYALERNLTIVRTYIDQARSGLRFKNRIGLRGLIGDIVDHKADFVLSWFMTSAAGVASRISTRAPTTSLFARRPASLSSTVQNSLKTMIALHPPS